MAMQPTFADLVLGHAQASVRYFNSSCYGYFPLPVVPPGLSEAEGGVVFRTTGLGGRACINKRLNSERGRPESQIEGEKCYVAKSIAEVKESANDTRLTEQLLEDCYSIGYDFAKEREIIEVWRSVSVVYGTRPTFADLARSHAQEIVDQQFAKGDRDWSPNLVPRGPNWAQLELIHQAASLGWSAGWLSDEPRAQCYRDHFDRVKRLSIRDPKAWEVIEDCYQIGFRGGLLWRPRS